MTFKATFAVLRDKHPNEISFFSFKAQTWGEAVQKAMANASRKYSYFLAKLERTG